MKRPLFLIFLLLAVFSLNAQESSSVTNRYYFKVGSVTNLSSVPLELYLDNSDGSITATEVYLRLPLGLSSFGDAVLDTTSCSSDHELITGLVDDSLFVSISSPSLSSFSVSESPLCTVFCDLSSLSDGVYNIDATGKFAVGVSDTTVTCYTSSAQSEEITISNGVLTGISEVSSDSSTGVLEIYTLGGVRLSSPQKGAINIINGKKVKL